MRILPVQTAPIPAPEVVFLGYSKNEGDQRPLKRFKKEIRGTAGRRALDPA